MNNSRQAKRYAVIGDPVSHSLSPLIHNAWIAAHGQNAHYEAVRLPAGENVVQRIRDMVADFAGLNVTLPHKGAALEAAVVSTPEARLVGAANTLVRDGRGWVAHNTDIQGFEAMLAEAMGKDVSGRNLVLIGAGGAARAVAASLHRAGARLVIVNRTRGNAESLAAALAPGARIAGLGELPGLAANADAIVNSASLGHGGGGLPNLPEGRGRPFLDLSYGKAAGRVLGPAARAGWTPHDGLTMLVAQAAAAFRIWFGVDPDQAGALQACRQAVAART